MDFRVDTTIFTKHFSFSVTFHSCCHQHKIGTRKQDDWFLQHLHNIINSVECVCTGTITVCRTGLLLFKWQFFGVSFAFVVKREFQLKKPKNIKTIKKNGKKSNSFFSFPFWQIQICFMENVKMPSRCIQALRMPNWNWQNISLGSAVGLWLRSIPSTAACRQRCIVVTACRRNRRSAMCWLSHWSARSHTHTHMCLILAGSFSIRPLLNGICRCGISMCLAFGE